MLAVGGFCPLPRMLELPLQGTWAQNACQVDKLLGGSCPCHSAPAMQPPSVQPYFAKDSEQVWGPRTQGSVGRARAAHRLNHKVSQCDPQHLHTTEEEEGEEEEEEEITIPTS